MINIKHLVALLASTLILGACGGGEEAAAPFVPPEPVTASLTVSRTGSGSISSDPAGISCPSDCSETYVAGMPITLHATPDTGYEFSGWNGDDLSCGTSDSCTFTLGTSKTVTATFSPKAATQYNLNLTIAGSGQVKSNVGGLDCSDDCSGTFVAGTTVTLTATPASGYTFSGWSVSGVSCTGTTCAVPMSAARSVTATFAPVAVAKFALTVAIATPGTGSVGSSPAGIVCGSDCTEQYNSGTVVRLGATPATGYSFAGWSGAGCTGNGTCDVTMSAARSVTATFAAVPVDTYALNTVIASGSGTVTSLPAGISCPAACSKNFTSGTEVVLTAVPAAGYRFSGWSSTLCSGTGTCTIKLGAAATVGASFVPITYALTVTKQGTGSGSVRSTPTGVTCGSTCTASFAPATAVTLTATPNTGSTFAGWSGACSGTSTCTVAINAATSVTATFSTIPTYVLTTTTSGSGTITSSPAGISCGASCSASFTDATSVTLTAQAGSGYQFTSWSGACTGTATTCTVSMTAARAVTASFSVVDTTPPPASSGGPLVSYTDTVSGPTKGGENGLGGYLSIYGKNLGTAAGLGTTTKVFIGAAEVANYRSLGVAKVGSKMGLQQLTVQVGTLGGAAAGTALPVKVVVDGVSSNVNNTFTPTNGKVLFVALSGNDSTAVAGDITKPWRYLQNQDAHTGAYFAMGAGDQVVLRGGEWSDTLGVDGTWMRASWKTDARNGTAAAWIHITAYPGPIKGNAIEYVHYTTPAGKTGGIAGPWSAITGTSGEYWAVSNLHLQVNAAAASDAAPINLQYTGGHWRVVNNELGPWPVAGVDNARAGGIAGYGQDVKILGNHIHDIWGTSALENHGIYVEGATTDWEIAYNWIHDITGGSLIQFNDVGAMAGTYALPHGGTWMGFTGMQVHHNWLENAAKFGLNVNDSGSLNGQLELKAWNNVIIGTKLPPVRTNSTYKTIDYTFAYNTIYNAMTSNSGSGNGYFRNEDQGVGAIRIYNNLLAIGPQTITGTSWFFDYSGKSSGWSFKNNLYWDAGRGLSVPSSDTAKVVGDPQFVNATLGNLALSATSPALNKALQAIPFTITDDLTGLIVRPSGSANDIGAFELVQ